MYCFPVSLVFTLPHLYFKVSLRFRDDYFENLGETNVLAWKMFTYSCRPWLKNLACLLSSLIWTLIGVMKIQCISLWVWQKNTNMFYTTLSKAYIIRILSLLPFSFKGEMGEYGNVDGLFMPRHPFKWPFNPGILREADVFLNGEKCVISDTNLN